MKKLCLDDIKDVARRHVPKPVGSWQHCSVLLPLVESDGELHVLYELRAKSLEVQPGEVSFPGGGVEAGETPAEAALRETVEELGLPADAIEIVSELDYLITYRNLTIFCFLGVIDADALKNTSVNRGEVEEYFLVPLSWLLENDPETYTNRVISEPAEDLPLEKLAPHGGYNWSTGASVVPIYTWPDPHSGKERIIWGMTARLTLAFTGLLKSR